MNQSTKFRHEWKHELAYGDIPVLCSRLSAVMLPDSHSIRGTYQIRSLYFDTPADKALREKIDGVNGREKFRIRYYNHDASLLLLEKKTKWNGLCRKEKMRLSREEVQSIVNGNFHRLPSDTDLPLLRELYLKMQSQCLRPKTIVDYIRRPFIYPAGNVRVTIDYNIRTGMTCADFLNPDCITVPAGNTSVILEVKWDDFLPSIIRDLVQTPGTRTSAFSKYAACRIYN